MLLLVLFSFQVVFDSSQPHGLQQTRPPCPPPSPGICPGSCSSNDYIHLLGNSLDYSVEDGLKLQVLRNSYLMETTTIRNNLTLENCGLSTFEWP